MGRDLREHQRSIHETEVVFYIDDDVMIASSIDISDSGVKIETEDPLEIRVQIKIEDKVRVRSGHLVWALKKQDGGASYGIRFKKTP